MPPSARKPAAVKKPDDEGAAARRAKDGEICGLCYPAGWPGDCNAATCEHGTWQR